MDSSLICPIYGEVKFTPYFYRFCYIFVIMVFEKKYTLHVCRLDIYGINMRLVVGNKTACLI